MDGETAVEEIEININTMKKFICNNALELNKESRVNIYCFLKNKVGDKFIIQNADGIRMDLNNLDSTLINELFNLIKYKIDEEKKI